MDHWKNSDRKQRWLATALLDLEPQLRRLKNYRALPQLRQALKANVQKLKKSALRGIRSRYPISIMQVDVIDAKKTAMIVVDMQNDFVASGATMETTEAREMVPKLLCRDAQFKVIYTAHVHRRDGRYRQPKSTTPRL